MDMLALMGIVSAAQVALTPLIVTLPSAAMMALSRHSLTLAFAVAAVWGRLWTYHKSYDDVMLVFLLVPLGVLAFRSQSRAALAAFAFMGALAWIPGRVLGVPEIQMLQLALWPAALAVLVVVARRAVTVDAPHATSRRLEHLHA